MTVHSIMVPTNTKKCIEINLYTQWTTTCFSQPFSHLQGCEIQKLDTLKAWNEIIRV